MCVCLLFLHKVPYHSTIVSHILVPMSFGSLPFSHGVRHTAAPTAAIIEMRRVCSCFFCVRRLASDAVTVFSQCAIHWISVGQAACLPAAAPISWHLRGSRMVCVSSVLSSRNNLGPQIFTAGVSLCLRSRALNARWRPASRPVSSNAEFYWVVQCISTVTSVGTTSRYLRCTAFSDFSRTNRAPGFFN